MTEEEEKAMLEKAKNLSAESAGALVRAYAVSVCVVGTLPAVATATSYVYVWSADSGGSKLLQAAALQDKS